MICSPGTNLCLFPSRSLMLSFSSFISCAKDCLLISSVNAASCIISRGVRCGFYSSDCQFCFWVVTDWNCSFDRLTPLGWAFYDFFLIPSLNDTVFLTAGTTSVSPFSPILRLLRFSTSSALASATVSRVFLAFLRFAKCTFLRFSLRSRLSKFNSSSPSSALFSSPSSLLLLPKSLSNESWASDASLLPKSSSLCSP